MAGMANGKAQSPAVPGLAPGAWMGMIPLERSRLRP